ncbi:DUF6090 family protein [Pseudomonadota bacterium]|jgi:hypothetical protein
MRPSKVVRAVNWRHAAGELVLIVAGILIALAISDWNEERVQREQEIALLQEIRYGLETDLKALESNLEIFIQAANEMDELQSLLRSRSSYDPSMDRLFGAVYGIRMTNLNTVAYETLKSVGLQSISNPELRAGIATVFDNYYDRLLGEQDIDMQVTANVMRPYYLQHFRDLKFGESATPMDYEEILDDTYFLNIVDYRLAVLRSNQLDSYGLTAVEIRKVLQLLNEEINR